MEFSVSLIINTNLNLSPLVVKYVYMLILYLKQAGFCG
jgi:hypothetical protein